MKGWLIQSLGSLGELTSSKRIFLADYVPFGIPFYRSKEIIEKSEGRAVNTQLFIDEAKYQAIKGRFGAPSTGDLLITAVGTLGKIYRVSEDDEFYFKDGNLLWLRHIANNVDSRYLCKLLKSDCGQNALNATAIGTSQPAYTIAGLKKIQFPIPPLPIQRKIAAVLSSYDDLIENNNRRIALLEKMGEELYREWFVRLRFPGHESTKIVKGVPEGWTVKRLENMVERRRFGKIYRPSDLAHDGVVPVIDQSTADVLGYHHGIPEHFATIEQPIILFGDHSCKMQLMIEPFSLAENVIPFVSSAGVSVKFLFAMIRGAIETQEYKRHWINLTKKEFYLPEREIQDKYSQLISDSILQVVKLRLLAKKIAIARDRLLTRLMSGKIDLEALDIAFPPSMEEAA